MIALVPESWGADLRESNGEHKGILVALWLKPQVAKRLAKLGTEPADEMHVTLSYSKQGTFEDAVRAVGAAVKKSSRLYGNIVGAGTFPPSESSDEKVVVWAKPNVPNMAFLRSKIVKALDAVGVHSSRDFNTWVPHITLAYVDKKATLPTVPKLPLVFDAITVAQGERRQTIPLGASRR